MAEMTLQEVMTQRRELQISLLELAAYTGLLESYLRQMEEGKILPLPADLERMILGIKRIQKYRAEP